MTQFTHYFRTHVLQTATKRKSSLEAHLSQPKVSDLEVSLEIDHDVLWFEVAVKDVFGVQVFNGQKNFNEISSRLFLTKPYQLFLQMKQLSPRTVVKNHDVKQLTFKELLHLHQKRKSDDFVDLSLINNQIHLAIHLSLLYELGSVKLAISPVPGEVDLAESSDADALEYIIGIEALEFLILINFEHYLKTKVRSYPPLPVLQLKIAQPVRIRALKIRHPSRQATQGLTYAFLQCIHEAWLRNLNSQCFFVRDEQGDGEVVRLCANQLRRRLILFLIHMELILCCNRTSNNPVSTKTLLPYNHQLFTSNSDPQNINPLIKCIVSASIY